MGEPPAIGYERYESHTCTCSRYCPPRCPRFVDKQGSRWTVRPARNADTDRLAALYQSFGAADRTLGVPPAVDHQRRAWIERSLADGRNIVAENQERIVGHVYYTPADAPRPELAVFVHPAFHNRGLGTELCKHATAAAVEADREALELHVSQTNRAAITVYQRLGFEIVDRDRTIQMVLPLQEQRTETVRDERDRHS